MCVLKISKSSTRKSSCIGNGGNTTGRVMREELVILWEPEPLGAVLQAYSAAWEPLRADHSVEIDHTRCQCWRSLSEDVSTRWLASWTWAIRSSLHPPLTLDRVLWPPFLQRSCFPGWSLERGRWCWEHLDGISGWTYLRSLYKLLRLYSSCDHPRQTSDVNSFAY